MKKTLITAAALAIAPAYAADAAIAGAQQNKMTSANKDAGDKKGDAVAVS